ncbi:MAG TPA: Xaa-Pro peptidase family protein [Acidimicrobiales bacterium]|jgi:Xaa-Pro aminopeptidase|nr:Xaa-Pro peptidase family protein [Acidimicrobiales bacterium]
MIDLASLPSMDIAARVPRLRVLLAEHGDNACDALLVTKLVNIRYLSGFTGSAGMLLVLPDELVLVTDGRYRDQAAEQLAAAGVEADVRIGLTMARQFEIVGVDVTGLRLGLEAHAVTWADQRAMATTHLTFVKELVPTTGLVESLRIVKDDGEVARIEAAATIATAALTRVRDLLDEHPTEHEFGLAIDTEIRRLGAEGTSFETIVGSGPNGAKPHHRAASSSRQIVDGELVVIDYGALVDGYCSDMTRTITTGEPSTTQQRMLDVVRAAQQAGVDAVRAGATAVQVDEACRAIIREAGWGDEFSHGTGHGVGLEIHEDPRVTWSSTATLAAGHVVTVEPGVYLPEHGGVRIEDTVVVTADGCRPLTHASKNRDLRTWPSPPTT